MLHPLLPGLQEVGQICSPEGIGIGIVVRSLNSLAVGLVAPDVVRVVARAPRVVRRL